MNKELEVWVDVPDYEGHYQVSNLGRVRSLDRIVIHKNGTKHFKEGQIQKLQDNGNGRLYKQMKRDGTHKNYYISRIVMLAFVGERPKGYAICHNDGDMTNNNLFNLRYDTYLENNIDQFRNNPAGLKGTLPLTSVLEIRKKLDTDSATTRELANEYEVEIHVIQRIKNRKSYYWLNDDGTIQESKTGIYFTGDLEQYASKVKLNQTVCLTNI